MLPSTGFGQIFVAWRFACPTNWWTSFFLRLLQRGSMFVFSDAQIDRLLNVDAEWKAERLLDLGKALNFVYFTHIVFTVYYNIIITFRALYNAAQFCFISTRRFEERFEESVKIVNVIIQHPATVFINALC